MFVKSAIIDLIKEVERDNYSADQRSYYIKLTEPGFLFRLNGMTHLELTQVLQNQLAVQGKLLER